MVSGANFNSVFTGCTPTNDGDKITTTTAASIGVKIVDTYLATCGTTTATLRAPWTGATGVYAWGSYTPAQQAAFAGGSNNSNYYDVTIAHHALFQATGNVKYKNYALALNTRWWTSPAMNRGFGLLPRLWQPTGLVA